MPAVVGGGWGDIAEVLDAGRTLERAGFPGTVYRTAGRPLPKSLDGPWDWSGVARRSTMAPRADRALTITPNWGVTAAPDRPGRLGRGGVWSVEAERIERAYGATRTLHVSLEEFARTLTSREENAERWREGGMRARPIARLRTRAAFRRDAEEFHEAFRRFRAFDRPNILHLFQGFGPSPQFTREFPEVVEVGPLWPVPTASSVQRGERVRSTEWVWYASPASSARLADAVAAGLQGTGVSRVRVRSPRPMTFASVPSLAWSVERPMDSADWNARFRGAALRIVTGSRTLLEALQVGGPFLYFNGVLGEGSRTHRHRPEKIQALLAAWRREGVAADLCRDLDAFSRARRVAPVVRRAATESGWGRSFPRRWRPSGYRPDRADAGRLLVAVARSFASAGESSEALVGAIRGGRRLPNYE
ncbi:MAG: hypothetical protein ACHQ16_03995 [Candidatus Lutacidiplasmatales archaeon]